MADLYAAPFVGVKDGTKSPPDRTPAGLVGAKQRTIAASKVAGQAVAIADQMYIGTLRQGERITEIRLNTDTSFATTTFSIGPKSNTTKYVNAATFTAPLQVPSNVGPRTAAAIAGVNAADEDLWATFGVAGIAGGANFIFEIDTIGPN